MSDDLSPLLREHLARREDALARVRRVLVEQLRVPLPPDRIDLDAPLFGTGLGLDSVDAVELVVAVENEFGFRLPEGGSGPSQLRTVGSLLELCLDPPTEVPPHDPDLAEVALPAGLAAIRRTAALARPTSVHLVRLRGEDARTAAAWLLPSALHLRDAQARTSLLLDARGVPFADVLVCADDEDLLLLIDSPRDPLPHLREHAQGDLTIEDLGASHEVLEVHGPFAWELVAAVLGSDFLALPYLNLFRLEPGYCVRAGRTGEFGYQIVVPREVAGALYARLLEEGARFDAVEVDAATLAHASFESWFFDAAHVPDGLTPVELQLEWRLADRDFLGRAAIDARRAEDPPRLTCLVGAGPMAAGDRVVLEGRDVGTVTRAAYSHAWGAHAAAALLPRALAHAGIDGFSVRGAPARTVAPPLIDNRSLYVDPRRHAYVTRDEIRFAPLARPGRAAMSGPHAAMSGHAAMPARVAMPEPAP